MKTELKSGSKYGKWTILEFDRVDEKRARRYFCRCDCGKESSVKASAIASGKTQSCIRCKSSDFSGKKFGLWTVLRRSDEKSTGTKRRTQWVCKCECGSEHLVERCNLIKGTSEGCWLCRRNVINAQYFPRIWYRKLKEQAKCRGHVFSITELELWEIWVKQDGKCKLTDMPIEISKNYKSTTASVDRIDNSKGYTEDNVWFIHKHVNMMKFKYDVDYFFEMCQRVVDKRQNLN